MCQQVAFRTEAEFLSSGNFTSSYLMECKLRGFVNGREQLKSLVVAYMKRNFAEQTEVSVIIILLMNSLNA